MEKNAKIYVSGHFGLVGSALIAKLKECGYTNIITRPHSKLDLTRQDQTEKFFKEEKPEYVFHLAAKVGGIQANMAKPANFLYDNLMISSNVLHASYKYNVKKLIYLGSSCNYPRNSPQPITEDRILTGALEPTNEGYALAKIVGLKMCEYYSKQYGMNFISAMSTNVYGPNDNFANDSSHVIPSLIRKIHNAKVSGDKNISIWGTGNAMREFLYVDDLAEALIYLMNKYNKHEIINIGTGVDISIKDLVKLISDIVGFNGKIEFDTSKPEGMPRKLLDISKIKKLGWKPNTPLREGIIKTYDWYLNNYLNKR